MRISRGLSLPLALLAMALAACQPTTSPQSIPDATAAHDATDAHAAEDSHHAHDANAALLPAPAQPWASDAPLRQGMEGIAGAIAEADRSAAAGRFDAAAANALTDEVDRQVQYMFANCTLEPDADAALHVLLTQLTTAAHGVTADAPAAGLARMREVLSHYPHYFEHAGWQGVAPPA